MFLNRFIEGEVRTQVALLPECLDDYVTEENPVRVVDVFVDELDLGTFGFEGVASAETGRAAYHPAILLRFISTVISIGFSLAAGWSVRPRATSN
jgi:transposase